MIALDQLDFRHTRVLVFGDLMLDQYWLGDTSRISPEAPVPVVKINRHENRLGGAANAALNVHSLGGAVTLAGIVGSDDNGRIIRQLLQGKAIEDLTATDKQTPTISKLRLISRNQQMLRADFEQAFGQDSIEQATNQCISRLADFPVLLLSDYNKGTLSQCQSLIEAANRAGCKVVVDPKGDDFAKYHQAFLLTPNMTEFETVVGRCESEQDMFDKAGRLINELQLQALLLTRSEKGMTLFLPDGTHHHFNARAREVFDVTGAGDTVIATLATALAKGIDLDKAVMLANTAAGIVVGRMGAASVTPLELKLELEKNTPRPTGIITAEQLQSLLAFEQGLGKTIVFTNGCFDILHAGHVQYLEEAAKLGDRLIVAINGDASVSRLKGPSRPINTVDDRMAVLASLGCVDWVLSFDGDTPEQLLEQLQPDILVKGGDYNMDQVVGADIVQQYGGTVKVLSLQEGISTTRIIDSIKGSNDS